MKNILLVLLTAAVFVSCKKTEDTPVSYVNFIFKFDSTQDRLNNRGEPSVIPAGNVGQSPVFNKMSAHYVELAQGAFTALGAGEVLYRAPETAAGGSNAIDFNQSVLAGQNEVFLRVPVSSITAGSYNWLRVSLAYQNYTIWIHNSIVGDIQGTVASFVGFNTYLNDYRIKDSIVHVNGNKLQGYWGFETSVSGFGIVRTGESDGVTTVPNPLFASSQIPAGSCVVTGQFASPLSITGTETSDINIIVSLSTNKSFEWHDHDGDGKYDPTNDDVFDMGIRGLKPMVQ
jgi:hypothetical protein